MTVEEIKEATTMRDVLSRYGVQVNKSGMCCCPIHGERHPSMKVYKDGYKCFACNSNGDIFKFIQEMEHCSFKDAFLALGGTYDKHKNENARIATKMKFERQKKLREQADMNEKQFRRWLMGAIRLCDFWIDTKEPFDDDWCYAVNAQQWLWHVFESKYIQGEKVEEAHVFRKCKEIRQRFITV